MHLFAILGIVRPCARGGYMYYIDDHHIVTYAKGLILNDANLSIMHLWPSHPDVCSPGWVAAHY